MLIKDLAKVIIPFLFIIFLGAFGYHTIEGWSFFDGFYMTMVTLTTVGYGETHPLSDNGKLFTIFLIVIGISNFAYIVRFMSIDILRPLVSGALKEKKLKKKLKFMSKHYIVCGYGRIGRDVVSNLVDGGKSVVVVDTKPPSSEYLMKNKVPFILGDASHEDILQAAGVDRASGLVASVGSEAENVFITLTAREMRQDLLIISRYEEDSTRHKLRRAGANRVVNPYHIGSDKISQIILKPTMSKILDRAYEEAGFHLSFEELDITSKHYLAGKTIRACKIKEEYNIMIVAIDKEDGQIIANPKADYCFENGDRVVMVADHKDFLKIC